MELESALECTCEITSGRLAADRRGQAAQEQQALHVLVEPAATRADACVPRTVEQAAINHHVVDPGAAVIPRRIELAITAALARRIADERVAAYPEIGADKIAIAAEGRAGVAGALQVALRVGIAEPSARLGTAVQEIGEARGQRTPV